MSRNWQKDWDRLNELLNMEIACNLPEFAANAMPYWMNMVKELKEAIKLWEIQSEKYAKQLGTTEAQLAQYKKALDLACEEVVEVDEGNCPGCLKDSRMMKHDGCSVPKENFKDCWRKHFLNKAEEALKEAGLSGAGGD